jgi:CheY-like chemotaxis protein
MSKILFFDDEPFYVNLLIDNLRLNHGWMADKKGEIKFISDYAEMIDEINSINQYDLFVLDIMVSSIGIEEKNIFTTAEIRRIERDNNMGILIAEKIRAIEKYKETPIICLSAKGNREIPGSLGKPIDCITKPTIAKDLSEKMAKMLGRK